VRSPASNFKGATGGPKKSALTTAAPFFNGIGAKQTELRVQSIVDLGVLSPGATRPLQGAGCNVLFNTIERNPHPSQQDGAASTDCI
jgi:hypothetical protein